MNNGASARASSVITRLHDHGEVLRASGQDPFVRWQLDPVSPPMATLQAWSRGGAVAFIRPSSDGPASLTCLGPVRDVVPLVAGLVHRVDATRLTVPRQSWDAVMKRLPVLRQGTGDDWDWMWIDRASADRSWTEQPSSRLVLPGLVSPALEPLGPDHHGEISALLAVASPRSSAVPGGREIVRWLGIRDVERALVACAAHTERVRGVPHLASITTHPRWRGRGLGSAITGGITRRLLAQGAPVVTLGMYADNDVARRIYGRLGFRCEHRFASRTLP